MRIRVPIGGAAAITLRGMPILSKAHGSADLHLHTALRFSNASASAATTGVDLSRIIISDSTQPAVIFEDVPVPFRPPQAIVLAKPKGKADLHLLGGRLLLSDSTDARLCNANPTASNAPNHTVSRRVALNPNAPLRTLEFGALLRNRSRGNGGDDGGAGSGSGALIVLTEGMDEDLQGGQQLPQQRQQQRVELYISADGSGISLHSGTLIVDNTDVRQIRQSCSLVRTPVTGLNT